MKSKQVVRIGTLFLSVLLILGETVVLVKTAKFWPLSVDDYFIATFLIVIAYLSKEDKYIPYLIAGWAFLLGNMYAMLFNRLDPVHGSGERINLLIAINFIAVFFLILSVIVYKNTHICSRIKETNH